MTIHPTTVDGIATSQNNLKQLQGSPIHIAYWASGILPEMFPMKLISVLGFPYF
jgi:hypothetical protein